MSNPTLQEQRPFRAWPWRPMVGHHLIRHLFSGHENRSQIKSVTMGRRPWQWSGPNCSSLLACIYFALYFVPLKKLKPKNTCGPFLDSFATSQLILSSCNKFNDPCLDQHLIILPETNKSPELQFLEDDISFRGPQKNTHVHFGEHP